MKREPIPTACEKCKHNWQARTFVNQQAAKSEAAKQAARENGKKGGRPCGSKKPKQSSEKNQGE